MKVNFKKTAAALTIKTILVLMPALMFTAAAGQDTAWTAKTANDWFDKGSWKNGLRLNGDSAINTMDFARQYNRNKAGWDKAFAFLRDSDLVKIKPGKYIIEGTNVYATITEGPEKPFDQTTWESHRKYIDLQYVIKGKEKIGVAPVGSAKVIKTYSETTDGANYTAEGTYYIAEPGTFFLFFPNDAHRPNIKVEGYDTVKKLVIKIRVTD